MNTPNKKIDGYVKDGKFIVTSDPDNIISPSYNSREKSEERKENVREYLIKYKPSFK